MAIVIKDLQIGGCASCTLNKSLDEPDIEQC